MTASSRFLPLLLESLTGVNAPMTRRSFRFLVRSSKEGDEVMRSGLVGFLGGVATACLTIGLFSNSPETAVQFAQPSADTLDTSTRILRQGSSSVSAVGAERIEPLATPQIASDFPESDSAREFRLRAEIEETQQTLAELGAELGELVISMELDATPILSPIRLPAEFDWISADRSRRLFHERMQREPIDSAWATVTETELLSVIYRQTDIVQEYGAPTIRCHTTRCEVTFLSTSRNFDESQARADLRALFDASVEEMDGAFDCGPGDCVLGAVSQDGIGSMFWGITKNENQSQRIVSVATLR